MNPIKRLLQAAVIAMGSAAYLVFLAVVIFSLPLNVIALMRWFNFEWWGALVTATFFGFIPILGQLGYAVLTVVGAYYFVDAGFNWKLATHPVPKEFSVAELTDDQFEIFKTNFTPFLENKCKEDVQRRFAVNGSSLPLGVTKFCSCFAQTVVSSSTRADFLFQETHHGDYSDATRERLDRAVNARCSSEVRAN